jgi:FkbM family methyltransferase
MQPKSAPAAPPVVLPGAGALPAAGRMVAQHRRNLFMRKVAGLCRRYASWYSNVSYDLETNGEAFVLDKVAAFSPEVLFDAGANVGDWAAAAMSRCVTAQVHAFEISPPTHKTLAARFRDNPRIVCRAVGLSNEEGYVRIRHYDGLEALTTATDYPHPFPYRELDVPVTTGSQYAAANGITRINFLKIDVEGMEEPLLKGFDGLFHRGAVDLVQFEYGRASIVTRFLLRDFYRFFEERGFRVGKIYPNYVDFRAYDMGDEDFLGPNYLACRADRTDYLAALGGAMS